jgi:hypothetical protein
MPQPTWQDASSKKNALVGAMDYRCDNRRFWLSAHNCQVPSSNPNFSKPRTRTANSDFWSWLTQQWLERLKCTILNLQIYLPKKANSEMFGLGIDNLCMIVFLSLRMNKCLERVNDQHFWNPGVFSYAIILRCLPNSRVFFFFIVTSIVHGWSST